MTRGTYGSAVEVRSRCCRPGAHIQAHMSRLEKPVQVSINQRHGSFPCIANTQRACRKARPLTWPDLPLLPLRCMHFSELYYY
jgi:hypothetical protein